MIKTFKRRKIYARFTDNTWAAELAESGSLSSFNHGIKYLLCVIDVFTKPLTDKKTKTIVHGLIGIVNESKRKPNKLWVDQGREFCNKLMQKWLDDNDILMNSTYNEDKSVVFEKFVRTLKDKIYKEMMAHKSYLES